MIRAAALALLLAAHAIAAEAPPVQSPLQGAFDAGWHGQKVCELLFDKAQMRAARCSFPPGVGHERHFHAAHRGYIVQGATMRITTAAGTVDRMLKAGDSWWRDGIDWHEAVNIGSETGVYIIVEPETPH